MSKAKHTPAPWRVEVPSDSNGYVNIETGGNGFIGYYGEICEELGKPTEVAMANARLIAASPEMYEMLKSCLAFVDVLDLHGIVDNWSDRPKLVELIKKIEG